MESMWSAIGRCQGELHGAHGHVEPLVHRLESFEHRAFLGVTVPDGLSTSARDLGGFIG